MTTTLYLPASGTPPLASLAVDTNWERTNGLVRLPCFTSKQNTALATTTMAWPGTTTVQWAWWQFQSEPLQVGYNWTTADTVSMVVGKCSQTTTGGDTHLAYVVRVVSGDGTVIRGVIGLYHATSSEYPLVASAATRIHSARVNGATNFSSQAGDRIVVEIGLHGVTPTATNITMRIGDPSATADFALTAGLTTDLCPWVRLSQTVAFGEPPAVLVIQDTLSANASENATLVQHHALALQEASSTSSSENVVLETGVILIVEDALSASVADSPNLIQYHILVLQEASSPGAAESPSLIQVHVLVLQDALSQDASESPTLVQHCALSVSDAISQGVSGEPLLVQHHVLQFSDARSLSSSENVVLVVPNALSVQGASSLTVGEVVLLVYQYMIFGAVKDRLKTPVSGASIYSYRASDGQLQGTAVSGSDGAFKVATADGSSPHFVVSFWGDNPRRGGVSKDTLVGT